MNEEKMNSWIKIAKQTEIPVWIEGPTGSGKTTLARKIHEESSRSKKPFVVVNLAAVHEGTFESTLFGHEKGAFTGAEKFRVGLVELAEGGTLFLDELTDLSLSQQAKLLEFLEDQTYRRMGSSNLKKANVRILCASQWSAEESLKRKILREDLFYRVSMIQVQLDSIKNQEDLFSQILENTLQKVSNECGRKIFSMDAECAEFFEQYSFPGNYRELTSVLYSLVLSSESGRLCFSSLPAYTKRKYHAEVSRVDSVLEKSKSLSYREWMKNQEHQILSAAMQDAKGSYSKAARLVNLPKATFIRKIKSLQSVTRSA